MGKFSRYSTVVEPKKRPWKIHPIWQGIGCLLMLLIPIISYAASVLFVRLNTENQWFPIPQEFIGPPGRELLFVELGITVLIALLGFILLVILYSIIYRYMGPPQKRLIDSEPIRKRPGKTNTNKR